MNVLNEQRRRLFSPADLRLRFVVSTKSTQSTAPMCVALKRLMCSFLFNFREETVGLIEEGRTISAERRLALQLYQRDFTERMDADFVADKVDAWVCPASLDHAPLGKNLAKRFRM